MTSSPVAICRFSDNNFKRLYLKKEWLLFGFILHLLNLHEVYKILKKKKSSLIITAFIASEKDVYLSV